MCKHFPKPIFALTLFDPNTKKNLICNKFKPQNPDIILCCLLKKGFDYNCHPPYPFPDITNIRINVNLWKKLHPICEEMENEILILITANYCMLRTCFSDIRNNRNSATTKPTQIDKSVFHRSPIFWQAYHCSIWQSCQAVEGHCLWQALPCYQRFYLFFKNDSSRLKTSQKIEIRIGSDGIES